MGRNGSTRASGGQAAISTAAQTFAATAAPARTSSETIQASANPRVPVRAAALGGGTSRGGWDAKAGGRGRGAGAGCAGAKGGGTGGGAGFGAGDATGGAGIGAGPSGRQTWVQRTQRTSDAADSIPSGTS